MVVARSQLWTLVSLVLRVCTGLRTQDGTKVQFDVGAQFFTSSTQEFNAIVDEWEKAGTATLWEVRD